MCPDCEIVRDQTAAALVAIDASTKLLQYAEAEMIVAVTALRDLDDVLSAYEVVLRMVALAEKARLVPDFGANSLLALDRKRR